MGVIWKASPDRLRTTSYSEPRAQALGWQGERLTPAQVAELVRDDLESFDPVLLMDRFPRCADGRVRLKATCFLRRYPAGSPSYSGSRLVLLATTGDTLSPEESRKRLVVVELQLRRLKPTWVRHQLEPGEWRRGGGGPAARRWRTPAGDTLVEGAESSCVHAGAYPIPGLGAGAHDYALHKGAGADVERFAASDEDLGKHSADYRLVRYQVTGASLVRLTYRFREESTFDIPLFRDPAREVVLDGLVPLPSSDAAPR